MTAMESRLNLSDAAFDFGIAGLMNEVLELASSSGFPIGELPGAKSCCADKKADCRFFMLGGGNMGGVPLPVAEELPEEEIGV